MRCAEQLDAALPATDLPAAETFSSKHWCLRLRHRGSCPRCHCCYSWDYGGRKMPFNDTTWILYLTATATAGCRPMHSLNLKIQTTGTSNLNRIFTVTQTDKAVARSTRVSQWCPERIAEKDKSWDRWRRKECNDWADTTVAGRRFHVRGAATGKTRPPTDDSLTDGTADRQSQTVGVGREECSPARRSHFTT